jgi:hypothetical protein
MLRVLFGDEGIADRPLDADRGIVPQDAVFILRTIEIAALVEELNSFGQRQESVCKSGRNEQLILLFRRKIHARPLSEVWLGLGRCLKIISHGALQNRPAATKSGPESLVGHR